MSEITELLRYEEAKKFLSEKLINAQDGQLDNILQQYIISSIPSCLLKETSRGIVLPYEITSVAITTQDVEIIIDSIIKQ